MKHFLLLIGTFFITFWSNDANAQYAYSENFCGNIIFVCPSLPFSDTILVEGYLNDPMPAGSLDHLTIDSVFGIPSGVSITITDSVLDYYSPLTSANSYCSNQGGVTKYISVLVSGNLSQPDTFDIYYHFTAVSEGYMTGFAGTSPTGSPYLTGNWINSGNALLCKVIVGGYVAPFTFTTVPTTCGQADGSLKANPTYPICSYPLPYTYSWSNGQTVDSAYNLSAGIHALSITNEIGCTNTYTTFLGSNGGPIVGIDTIIPICSNVGTMELLPTGNGPFSYSWSTGNTSNIQTITRGNHYSGLVWDANNCPTLFDINIPNKHLMTVYPTITKIKCHGDTNGKITLNPLYGTAPYSYSWSTGITGTNIINNLGPNTYSWTVSDANGCSFTNTTTMIDPPVLHITSNISPASCPGACNGLLDLGATGGWGSYSFYKNNQSFYSNPPNFSCAGTFFCKVVDWGGCKDSVYLTVGDNSVTITSITPECTGLNNGEICVDYNNLMSQGYYSEVYYTNPHTGSYNGPFPISNCLQSLNAGYYDIYIYFTIPGSTIGCLDQGLNITIDSISSVPASFSYTQNGNTLSLTAMSGASTYYWSGINLTSGNNPTFTANNTMITTCTLPSAGLYEIQLLVDSGSTCYGVFTDTIYYQLTCDIGGNVLTGINSADEYKVYLINFDTNTQLLTAVDSFIGNPSNNGAYLFSNLPLGDYRVKAALFPTSTQYAGYLPTYYQNSLFWNQATVVGIQTPCVGNFNTYDISLTAGTNAGGPGFIGGYVFNGANKILTDTVNKADIEVILFDDAMQAIAYDYSDNNGYVSFSNLPLGTYHLMADALNQVSDTIDVTLSTNTTIGEFSFYLLGDSISGVNTTTDINYSTFIKSVQVLPNPHSQAFQIQASLIQSALVSYQLYDPIGQKIWESTLMGNPGQNTLEVSSEKWSSGVYFLYISIDDNPTGIIKVIRE